MRNALWLPSLKHAFAVDVFEFRMMCTSSKITQWIIRAQASIVDKSLRRVLYDITKTV